MQGSKYRLPKQAAPDHVLRTSSPACHATVPPDRPAAVTDISSSVGPVLLQGNTTTAYDIDVRCLVLPSTAITHRAVHEVLWSQQGGQQGALLRHERFMPET